MINQFAEAMNQKKTDQYKIIEAKYQILLRYLNHYFDDNYSLNKSDIQLFINSLENSFPESEESKESEEKIVNE